MFIDHRALRFTMLTKCKNDEDCRCSRSALAPCLRCWPDRMIWILSFLLPGMALPTLALVFWMPPYLGFIATLGLELRFGFASLSCLSMLLFHYGRTADSRLLSCVLVLVNLSTQLQWGCKWPLLCFWHRRV
jgi:hypothetical protein